MVTPSGKTNSAFASGSRLGSMPAAIAAPTATGSVRSPQATPVWIRTTSELITSIASAKFDSFCCNPTMTPSAEHPDNGAPSVASRTAFTMTCWL
jgi:hypothetical protein